MKHRILLTAILACFLIVITACESDGRRFDPTRVLDHTAASDDQFLPEYTGDQNPGVVLDGDDDDDDDCPSDSGDNPDEYDDEMIPTGDGDDDDDDDC